ncbi:MAG: SIMPL domain-containing protein [Patescibacteria group bacterium]
MKISKSLQILFGLFLAALIVFVGSLTRNSFEDFKQIGKVAHDRDTIVIQGEGKATSKPDLALIDLGVTTDGITVKEAQKSNTQKMNAIIGAVKDLGVDEKDIQTANYTIFPKYQYDLGKQTVIGYTVSQDVSIKVRDLDKAGDILAKAGELGANQIGGLRFSIDDPQELKVEARSKAILDARTKAEALAKQLGLSIVRVVTFSESSGGVVPPQPYYAKAIDMASSVMPTPEIESGSLDVMSSVYVTFEVR